MSRRPEITLLRTVARELAAALECGTIPKPQRAGARALVLRAWQASEARGADTAPLATVADLTRRIDALVAGSAPTPDAMRQIRLPAPVRICAELDPPLLARVQARIHATEALVERTRLMVERAVAAEDAANRVTRSGTGSDRGKSREDLELVRGDSEPAPGTRRQRTTGATRR